MSRTKYRTLGIKTREARTPSKVVGIITEEPTIYTATLEIMPISSLIKAIVVVMASKYCCPLKVTM